MAYHRAHSRIFLTETGSGGSGDGRGGGRGGHGGNVIISPQYNICESHYQSIYSRLCPDLSVISDRVQAPRPGGAHEHSRDVTDFHNHYRYTLLHIRIAGKIVRPLFGSLVIV
jgi:hypothetical protein